MFITNTKIRYIALTEEILRDRITYGEAFGLRDSYDIESPLTEKELNDAKSYIIKNFPQDIVVLYYPDYVPQMGYYTQAYISKLNTLYPTLNLLASDSIEDATTKLTNAGVTLEEVDTLLGWYERRM